jgi:thiamine-monophosphate kinase
LSDASSSEGGRRNGPRPEGSDGEDRLTGWLRRQPRTELLGDDAALLPTGPRVTTVDSQVEGVHFLEGLDPAVVARRLLAVNLSDLAAVGAVPRYALLALSARPGFDHRRFLQALLESCGERGVRLVGGDLARSPGGTVATLTLLGDLPHGGGFLRRRDARSGDELWVGGTLGESAAGQRLLARGARLDRDRILLPVEFRASEALARAARQAVRRHLLPQPQLDLGRRLGRLDRVAAMDLSDGLARDLPRLCRESDAGAEVEVEALPLAPAFDLLCKTLGEDPVELAMEGGEDYVLLFAVPEGGAADLPATCRRIGRMIEEKDLRRVRNGRVEPWPSGGWDHLEGRVDQD